MNDGKDFEIYSAKYHQDTFSHNVWLTPAIPESELYNAGLINNFNKIRTERVLKLRKSKGKTCMLDDYGLDFLSYDPITKLYHYCQCKNYKNKVTATDIGTFLAISMRNLPTQSFLYTTSSLQINLYEIVQETQYINHIKLQFSKIQPEIEKTNELKYKLRKEQQEAVDITLQTEGRMIWAIHCGFGKTLTLAHYLQKRPNTDIIICMAPLKEHVKNLQTRVTPFLKKHYASILIDSDNDGTTDTEVIDNFLMKNERVVIYTTFDSAVNIVLPYYTNYRDDNLILVVDEAHNIVSNANVIEMINSFDNCLLLSATIPEEIYDCIDDAKCVYKFGLNDGIKNNYISDYKVILPYENLEKLPIDGVPEDIGMKAMFLSNGMLDTGSRRCIVYMNSQEECGIFEKVFKKVCKHYHGLTVWSGTIISHTTSIERENIKHEFQYHNRHNLHIILSVRILDEAVDIPMCDSTFIASVGKYSSDIRLVQRMCRGSRLYPNGLKKINHLFLWCTDLQKNMNIFTLLRDEDINFHKKIKVLGTDYKGQDNQDIKNDLFEKNQKTISYIQNGYVSMDERFRQRIEAYKKFQEDNKIEPKNNSEDMAERSLGMWRCGVRKNFKNGKLSQKNIDLIMKYIPHILIIIENDEAFRKKAEEYKKYEEENGKPDNNSKNKIEQGFGAWRVSVRKYYKINQLSQARINIINEIIPHILFFYKEDEIFKNKAVEYKKFQDALGKAPSVNSTDPTEKKHAVWRRGFREYYKKGEVSKERVEFINNLLPEILVQIDDIFREKAEEYKKFEETHGRPPAEKSKDPDERKNGHWRASVRQEYKKNKLSQERIDIINELIPHILDVIDVEGEFREKVEKYKALYDKLGKHLSEKSLNKDEKISAKWRFSARESHRNGSLSQAKIDIINEILPNILL